MKNTLKKAISVIIALTVIFGSFAFGFTDVDWSDFAVKAAEGYFTSCPYGELYKDAVTGKEINPCYESNAWHCHYGLYSNGEATVIKYCAPSYVGIENQPDSITIPSTYCGYPVTKIGNETGEGYVVFRNAGFKSITLPSSIKTICAGSFEGSKLESVSIPSSVTTIEPSTFYGCPNLTNVSIGNGVNTIGEAAFFGCNSLTNVVIPNSVRTIGNDAFYNCHNLKGVTIGNGVTDIGTQAFCNCFALTNIAIPDNVKSLGEKAFASCSSLESVTIGNGITNIDNYMFMNCYKLADVNFGENVKTIGQGAFYYCQALNNVTLPDSLKTIEKNAFYTCNGLTDISIPYGVKTIGEGAFSFCAKLKNVTMPDGLTTIEKSAFSFCNALKNVTIPASVTSIGNKAFAHCQNLELITVDKNNENYLSDGGILFTKDKTRLMQYPAGSKRTNYIVPDGVTTIDDGALSSVNLEYVHIPESVTSMERFSVSLADNAYICSTSEDGYIKEYAEANGFEFRVCNGHNTTNPEPTTKPVVTEPATTKPAEVPTITEPSTTKPAEIPSTTKPVGTTKPVAEPTTKPVVTRPATTKPVESTTKPEPTTKPVSGFVFRILKPSVSVVKYGETLILHTNLTSISANEKIEWSVEGEGVTIVPSADGLTCAVTSTSTGDVTITAKYTDANGVEHVSEQEIKSNASFWQKIVSFFKNLFGISRIIEQVIKF